MPDETTLGDLRPRPGFCLRHEVETSDTGQSSPASFSRLATIPAVRRSGISQGISIDRQARRAASENTAGRISGAPRLRSDAVSLDPFVVRSRAGGGLPMQRARHQGSAT